MRKSSTMTRIWRQSIYSISYLMSRSKEIRTSADAKRNSYNYTQRMTGHRRSATKRSARTKLVRDKQHLSRKPSRYTVKTASTPCIDHRNILVTNAESNLNEITQQIFGRPKNDHTPARLGWFSPGIFPVEVANYQRTQQPAAKTGQLKANPNLSIAAPPGGPGLPSGATGDYG